jgi:hypothetical protein
MRIYECENCGSLFIVNETDERVECGDYSFINGCNCPLCSCDMIPINANEPPKDG